MRAILTLLATLVLGLGVLSGALVHATEVAGNPELTLASSSFHIAGDADEVRGDGDKAMPHHHNVCHGHDVAAPFSEPGSICLRGLDRPSVFWSVNFLDESPHFGLLRPPKP